MTIIAYLWGIHTLTPLKCVWLALTLANVGMMLLLAFHKPWTIFGFYMTASALGVFFQGSPQWTLGAEEAWAIVSAFWVYSMLPRDRYGRIFALSIGLLITCALMYAVPPSWPKYDPAQYYTRVYSVAAFLGVVTATCLLCKVPESTWLAIPWFTATLVAGANHESWSYWVVALIAKSVWSCCLIGWLYLSRSGVPAEIGDSRTPSTAVLPRSHPE